MAANSEPGALGVGGRYSGDEEFWDGIHGGSLVAVGCAEGPAARPQPGARSDGEDERLWSARETADYLGVPVTTLYWWRTTATGPPARRISKDLRYRPQDVRDWVASLSTEVGA